MTQLINESLASIVGTCKDYEHVNFDEAHVYKWLTQFPNQNLAEIAHELDMVLKKSYFSKATTYHWMRRIIKHESVFGQNYRDFWQNCGFINAQNRGASQGAMLEMFNEALKEELGFGVDACENIDSIRNYIYLDDGIYTGATVKKDLIKWCDKLPKNRKYKVYIITLAYHTGAFYQLNKLKEKYAGQIIFPLVKVKSFENRKVKINASNVYWPCELPESDEVRQYKEIAEFGKGLTVREFKSDIPIQLPFFSHMGRRILEEQLTWAGCKIALQDNAQPYHKPLGYNGFGFGFGSTIVTYRNCPNNAPLAFWWGKTTLDGVRQFSGWYPLFPRVTNSQRDEGNFDAIFS